MSRARFIDEEQERLCQICVTLSLIVWLYISTKKVDYMEIQGQQRQNLWIPGATTVGVTCPQAVILASEKRVSLGYHWQCSI